MKYLNVISLMDEAVVVHGHMAAAAVNLAYSNDFDIVFFIYPL